jgi:serine/threonine protein kinase/sugar lactone lactonase YvrE
MGLKKLKREPMPLSAGQILQHRYRIVSLLGEGGMGAVYRVWDTRLDVPVALKEMVPQPGLDVDTLAQLRQQFHQEAKVLARLDHPHLVRVSDFFEEAGNAYLVMSFVDGEELADLIEREGAQPDAQVRAWAEQLLDALAYCHECGVIHRDVKPQNVIICPDGKAVLVDFGLVKLWDPADPRTRTAMRGMGTPEYAPPEQYSVRGQHTDPRSDLYSLGATLYHALTGEAPLSATDRMAMPEEFRTPRQIIAGVSEVLELVILQAVALPIGERWSDAAEMRAALSAPTAHQPTKKLAAEPPPPPGDGVAALYHRLQDQMAREEWDEAERTAQAIELLKPGYQDTSALLQQIQDNRAGKLEVEGLLQSLGEELAQDEIQFQRDQAELVQEAASIDEARSELDVQQGELEDEQAELRARLTVVEQALVDLDSRRGALVQRAQEVDGLQAELREREAVLAARKAVVAEVHGLFNARRYQDARRRLQTAYSVDAAPAGLNEKQVQALRLLRVLEHPRRSSSSHEVAQFVADVAFCPRNQDLLASSSEDGRVWLWRASDGKLLRNMELHKDEVRSVAFSPDGETLIGGGGRRDPDVHIWQVSDGKHLHRLKGHSGGVNDVAFSPDGKLIASAGGYGDTTVRLWRASDGRSVRVLDGHARGASSVAFSPDGVLVASGAEDGALRMWQVSDGSLLYTHKEHTDIVRSVSFSPDGALLVSCSWDRKIHLWRAADGKLIRRLEWHPSLLYDAVFSPDGVYLFAGAYDCNVPIWRVADGKLLHTLKGHKGSVWGVAFSSDGTLVASSAADGTVRLWGV